MLDIPAKIDLKLCKVLVFDQASEPILVLERTERDDSYTQPLNSRMQTQGLKDLHWNWVLYVPSVAGVNIRIPTCEFHARTTYSKSLRLWQ